MYVFCYPSDFRIKSKADAEKFLTISKGCFSWCDGTFDYSMENGEVVSKPVHARGDIFFPCLSEPYPVDVIWKTRKHINKELSRK